LGSDCPPNISICLWRSSGVSLLRNRRAFGIALLAGVFSFAIFNRIFNPLAFSGGFHWLVSLATHKGVYGTGEPGFIDFDVFWPNMGQIIVAAPLGCVLFVAEALAAFAQMLKSRRYFDPVSLTLVAAFLAFLAQLVATAKHFALHYMMASWALTGGVLVLTICRAATAVPAIIAKTARCVRRHRWRCHGLNNLARNQARSR
jgi:hypothetical protein